MLKKTKLEEFKDKLKAGNCMHEDLVEFGKEIGVFSIIQHPDYEQDIAYDIDDVLELLELVMKD